MSDVLILTPFYPPNIGGAETFTYQLCEEAKKWYHVTVLTNLPFKGKAKAYEDSYTKRGSLTVRRYPWLIKQSNAWKGTSLKNILSVIPQMGVLSLLTIIRKRPRIIHSQGLLCGFIAVLLKRIFKVKAYITLLAIYDFRNWNALKKRAARFVIEGCDCVFVEGNSGAKDIDCFNPKKVVRFNHWVDQDVFKPGKRFDDKIRILFVGRPIPEKGRSVIETAERLLNDPNVEFTYVDEIKYEALPEIYRGHHICCVPSIYNEGFTRVVAESSSSGCAVFASDRGSLPEMVRGFGYTIEPDGRKWAEFLAGLDIEQINLMGVTAFAYAKERFNRQNAEVFLNEYSTID